MIKKLFAALVFCFCVLGAADATLAQADRDIGKDPLLRLQKEGWVIVQDGVLRREAGPGEVETFVYGVEGFTWRLQDLRAQLRKMRAELAVRPTPELRRAIASHRKMIASTQERIERARVAEAGGKHFTIWDGGCNLNFGLDALAAHKVNVSGAWATASADFNVLGHCEYDNEGQVYAYATAQTTVNGAPSSMIVADGPRTGTQVNASAEAHRNGGAPCESYSYSEVISNTLSPSSYSKTKTNTSCPAASTPATLQVSISSDYDSYGEVVIREERCVTVTWTVNIAGGTPFYTANIYRNGVLQRTGTSYSEQFCFDQAHEENYVEYVDIDVYAQVTDSGGQSRTVYSPTVTLHYLWWIY
jgi:hypothetical protein